MFQMWSLSLSLLAPSCPLTQFEGGETTDAVRSQRSAQN